MIYFPLYEYLKNSLEKNNDDEYSFINIAISSFLAKCSYKFNLVE